MEAKRYWVEWKVRVQVQARHFWSFDAILFWGEFLFVSTIFYLVAEKVREGKGREGNWSFWNWCFQICPVSENEKGHWGLDSLVRIKGNDFVFENGKRGIGAGNVFVVLGGFKNCFWERISQIFVTGQIFVVSSKMWPV